MLLPTIPNAAIFFAYAEVSSTADKKFLISSESSIDCHGAYYCTIGAFSVDISLVDEQTRRDGRKWTQKPPGGYYCTPEHAEGDIFPARVQWGVGDLNYSVEWYGLPKKRAGRCFFRWRRPFRKSEAVLIAYE